MIIKKINTIKDKTISDIIFYIYDIIKHLKNECMYTYMIRHLKKVCDKQDNVFSMHWDDGYTTNIQCYETDIARHYLEHFFDLLGSGWVNNDANREVSESLWIKDLLPSDFQEKAVYICKYIHSNTPEYSFIDWHRDFKNNHRFNAKLPSSKILISEDAGYDIKIPWELSRLQHLPFLGRLYLCTKDEKYILEIRNEILDFIAFNPVGFGVNWKCSMDVAIRVANCVMSVSMVLEEDKVDAFDSTFLRIFKESILEHSIFLRYHLEDRGGYRGNHYLADIIGLLFSLLYLEKTGWREKILDFSVTRFLKTVDEQFYDDGGNFESSIAYHKLSLEMVIYGIWIIGCLKKAGENNVVSEVLNKNERLFERVICKLNKATEFYKDSLKPNYDIYQLGDNDSGHLFRFFHYGCYLKKKDYLHKYLNVSSCIDDEVWDENELSGKELLDLIGSLQSEKDGDFFSYIISNSSLKKSEYISPSVENSQGSKEKKVVIPSLEQFEFNKKIFIPFNNEMDVNKVRLFYYPCFGYYGYKSEFLFFGIFAGNNGQNGRGGHSHNDKLACELQLFGKDIILDPGTYVYTVSSIDRNKFRSTSAHFIPYLGEEQSSIGSNCFQLKQTTKCDVLKVERKEMIFKCEYGNCSHLRRVILHTNGLSIEDYTNKPIVNFQNFEFYSNGYGKIVRRKLYD